MNNRIFVISILSLFVLFSSSSLALAHPHEGFVQIDSHSHEPQTEYISLNGVIGLEKTSLVFHVPEDNAIPWGFVEGKISNPVKDYPVIIQIHDDDDAVHFAQTDVNPDGTYEYNFRVLTVENEKTIFLQKYPLLFDYQEKLDEYCSLEELEQDYSIEKDLLIYEANYDWDIDEIIEEYCEIPDQNKTIKLFDGDYYVTIFKVVYLNQNNLI